MQGFNSEMTKKAIENGSVKPQFDIKSCDVWITLKELKKEK
jgi:hypothetical protein